MPRPPQYRSRKALVSIVSGVAVAVALLAATPARPPAALPAEVMAAGRAIAPARLEAHVRTLADDKLEGRGTATPGYDMAAQYVAEQMQAIGLEPGGRGGYLQPVPFVRADLKPAACSFALVKQGQTVPLEVGKDVLLSPDYLRSK